ncbi:hypothetical protein Kisp01_71120 [Kineosporia sp. NBRC 101677]|nr:hypothetical protein Kisp01_71120 [Kineosporia sp. NBRC 101677]
MGRDHLVEPPEVSLACPGGRTSGQAASDVRGPVRHAVIRRERPGRTIAYIRLSLVTICYTVELLWLREGGCDHLRQPPPRALGDGFPGWMSEGRFGLGGALICSCH